MQYNLKSEIQALTQNYINNVLPYESFAKTIATQQQQLQQLEKEYKQLMSYPEVNEQQQQRLCTYAAGQNISTRKETKKWLAESIKNAKSKLDVKYPILVNHLQTELQMKAEIYVSNLTGTNALCNLQGSWDIISYLIENIQPQHLQRMKQSLNYYARLQTGEVDSLIQALKAKTQKL